MSEEFTIELARLEREVHERIRRRNAVLQRGEAWVGIDSEKEAGNDRV